QDLDAIHTQYMTKVFWDPQWKASRREMLAGQMYLYHTDLCFYIDGGLLSCSVKVSL
ncbi:hypothetical protein F2P79_021140, partial [Pimephales promelas]